VNDPCVLSLSNEFAAVRVMIDRSGNGPRLEITDMGSGISACLDPLELRSLALVRHADLAPILEPRAHEDAAKARTAQESATLTVAVAEQVIREQGRPQ
jgi:hypothetical protein